MQRQVEWVNGSGQRGRVAVPVIVHRAERAGPTVVITANIHGDEAGGTVVCHQLDQWLPYHLTCGQVVLYPSLNPDGLAEATRVFPEDGGDLNRLFPGDRFGTLARRHAARLWADICERKPDLLIDLHADSANAVPYAIADRAVSGALADKRAMAEVLEQTCRATGLLVLHEYPDEQYLRFHLDRSLAGAMVNRQNTPAITIEAGPRGWISGEGVRQSMEGVVAVLADRGMADATFARSPRPGTQRWRRAAAPRIRRGGLLMHRVAPGETFVVGQTLAEVMSVDNAVVDTVVAPQRGVVVSWLATAWVAPGAVVGTLGLEEE